MPEKSILIVDDDSDVLNALRVLLEDDFERIITENNVNRLPRLLVESFDVILLDMNFSAGVNSGNEGLFWLGKIIDANPSAAVVMMTAYGKIDLAVEAIKRGARDFVLKPWDNEKLVATLLACLTATKTKGADTVSFNFILGKSKAMLQLQQQIEKVAATDASVLILGENGTGKELVARALHNRSLRAGQAFVTVDMSTLTSTLFESELFGHKKGAFTDAKSDRIGRIVAADKGTLFLDEIGNLHVAQQAKLLTVFQSQEVIPVGSNQSISINVRLVSATNAPLQSMAESGAFRMDLLYRINTITLHVPPLRERGDDILLLAEHFFEIYKKKYNRSGLMLDEHVNKTLLRYHWPGNVRELQHTIEKAVILANEDGISIDDLNLSISSMPMDRSGLQTLDEVERVALQRALKSSEGNIVQAAKSLGITRQTLYNKMKKYGL